MSEILWLAFVHRKDFRMTSHTRAMRTLTLWSFAAAMTWFAGTARAQDLHGEALVKALQKGGYVLVMRHASSPREVPDKQAANPDNSKPERQLDEVGRNTAIAMGKALRDLRIPIGNVLSSPPIAPSKPCTWLNSAPRRPSSNLGITVKACRVGRPLKPSGCRSKWHTFPPAQTRSL
jgi:hypothetical protein